MIFGQSLKEVREQHWWNPGEEFQELQGGLQSWSRGAGKDQKESREETGSLITQHQRAMLRTLALHWDNSGTPGKFWEAQQGLACVVIGSLGKNRTRWGKRKGGRPVRKYQYIQGISQILVVYKHVVQKKMVTWTRVVEVEVRKGGLLHQFWRWSPEALVMS